MTLASWPGLFGATFVPFKVTAGVFNRTRNKD